MVAEGYRGLFEEWRRLGKLEHRFQVADAPVGRVHLGHQWLELGFGQLFRNAAYAGTNPKSTIHFPTRASATRTSQPPPMLARRARATHTPNAIR